MDRDFLPPVEYAERDARLVRDYFEVSWRTIAEEKTREMVYML